MENMFNDFDIHMLLQSNIIIAVVILIVGFILIKLITKSLKAALKKTKAIDGMLNKFIVNAVRIALWASLIMAVITKLGIDASSILAVFAAAGAAIALALQGSLSNLASGILIIFNKPFIRGDFISGGGSEGVVDSIDLLYTTIVTNDNKIVSIPNSALTSSSITNWTKSGSRRLDITIGVSYDSNIELAKDILKDIARNSGYYLLDKELSCNVIEYADSSVILQLRGWVGTPAFWPATYAVNNAIKPAFDRAGIEIPYPQIDVHKK